MLYLVDGYNFVFRLKLKRRFSLQQLREEFIKSFSACVKKLRLHVTLVFDGKDQPIGSYTRGNWKEIDIIYTHYGLSADEYIINQIENSERPHAITVVTSDRELGNKARMCGSTVISVENFMQFLVKKESKKHPSKEKPPLHDVGFHFERLLRIFEDRLKEEK